MLVTLYPSIFLLSSPPVPSPSLLTKFINVDFVEVLRLLPNGQSILENTGEEGEGKMKKEQKEREREKGEEEKGEGDTSMEPPKMYREEPTRVAE